MLIFIEKLIRKFPLSKMMLRRKIARKAPELGRIAKAEYIKLFS